MIPAIVACRDSVAKYITNPGGQAFNVISGMGIPYRHYYVSARYDFLDAYFGVSTILKADNMCMFRAIGENINIEVTASEQWKLWAGFNTPAAPSSIPARWQAPQKAVSRFPPRQKEQGRAGGTNR